MKKNRILGILSASMLMMGGACSSDLPDQGKLHTSDEAGGVFMSIDIKMPNGQEGTRSSTVEPGDGGTVSNSGTEIGYDEENNVTTALIVLASTEKKGNDIDEFGFIVAGEVQNNHISFLTDASNKQYRAAARLQKDNLNTLYELYGDGNVPVVYVFVFCNPTKELSEMFVNEKGKENFGKADWIKKTCTVIQGSSEQNNYNIGIWGTNSFLMNNVQLETRKLPANLLDWENFTSYEKAFKLSDNNEGSVNNASSNNNAPDGGSVLVERSVARFDFKDGSKLGHNTYDVLFHTDENGNTDETPLVDIQLTKMCLVNMGNQFYYLPRVSDNGQYDGPGYTLCGNEKPWERLSNGAYQGGNYVVGPYAQQFDAGVETDFSNYFNFPFFGNDGIFSNTVDDNVSRWDVYNIEDVLKNGRDDQYVYNENNQELKSQYKIWRYVTENVIPGPEANQVNGISTGVVFKGKMVATQFALDGKDKNGTDLYEESWNKGNIQNLANCLNGKSFTFNGVDHTLQGNSKDDPILYYFAGHLYMGWRHIRQAAIQASVTLTNNPTNPIEINRSNSLYKAVFGDGPIPPGQIYVKDDLSKIDINDPRWNTNEGSDEYMNYLRSANYAWEQWSAGGKEEIDDNQKPTDVLTAMRDAVTSAGITIYQSSTEGSEVGYYCYYYYWNRHNDNGRNGSMGPMEFDIVRNNVYKLSVDKISRLGHPRIPENDPNNPTPDTPDEIDQIYLDVRVQIAPWVVRVNSIVF